MTQMTANAIETFSDFIVTSVYHNDLTCFRGRVVNALGRHVQ